MQQISSSCHSYCTLYPNARTPSEKHPGLRSQANSCHSELLFLWGLTIQSSVLKREDAVLNIFTI